MRIIAGSRKGLKLYVPEGRHTRPTEDRIKENAFNLMGQQFFGAKVLDLFSGTGSIGLEFLSRGAEKVYFVDNNRAAADCIEANIEKAHFTKEEAVVYRMNAASAIQKLSGEQFDFIYLDPPYKDKELYVESVKNIIDNELLTENGYIVIEEEKNLGVDFEEYLTNVKFKSYGLKSIGIWVRK